MKIEKYNQRLLALLGTIGTIFLVIALFAFIGLISKEYNSYSSYEEENGILSNEKVEKLQEENKRKQLISFENLRLIDTLNSVYIIPVSQKTLNQEENINGLLGIGKNSSYESSNNRYSKSFYGTFNNLIIYESKTGKNKKLFNNRVNFNRIETEYFDDDILLLMKVAEKDTSKDRVINLQDLKSLYIYSLKEEKLKKISLENMDVSNYEFLNKKKNISILFGIDKNKNGEFEQYREPTTIKRYNYSKESLVNLVDEKIIIELQKTLEGTKK
jgi:hypothetical protein